jgi:hypothetical protein
VLDDILADATPVRPMRFYKMPGGTEIEKEVLMAEEAPPPSPDVPYVSVSAPPGRGRR